MLIYEKTVEGVRHLFGTLGNIPSNDDPQLMYKDASGKEIDNIKDFKLFYGTNKEMKGSLQFLPTDSDTVINVFIGDTMVIGSGDAPAEEPGIYYYDEETGKPYLAMTWAEVRETYSDAFTEVESIGTVIEGIVDDFYYSWFSNIDEPFKIVIGEDVNGFYTAAFASTNLVSIYIPNSVVGIANVAFQSCRLLATITIPDSVEYLGTGIFSLNDALTDVNIPDSVTEITASMFAQCPLLANINYGGTMTQWESMPKGEDWDSDTGNYTVHCTDGDIPKQ